MLCFCSRNIFHRYEIESDTFFLDDQNSTNGTFLNDVKLSERLPLHQYDFLRFGTNKCTFRFERDNSTARKTGNQSKKHERKDGVEHASRGASPQHDGFNSARTHFESTQRRESFTHSTAPMDKDVLTDDSLDDDIVGGSGRAAHQRQRQSSRHQRGVHHHTALPEGDNSGSDEDTRQSSAPSKRQQRHPRVDDAHKSGSTSRSHNRPATVAHGGHQTGITSGHRRIGSTRVTTPDGNDEGIDVASSHRPRSSTRHRSSSARAYVHVPSEHRHRAGSARVLRRASGAMYAWGVYEYMREGRCYRYT